MTEKNYLVVYYNITESSFGLLGNMNFAGISITTFPTKKEADKFAKEQRKKTELPIQIYEFTKMWDKGGKK